MFVVVQFPIADIRYFSGAAPGKHLLSPRWPPRTDVPSQFLRLFGAATLRYRGVDRAWSDEVSYCRAHRALRFTALPETAKDIAVDSWKKSLRCAFRRMLFDGKAVSRVEVGFSLLPYSRHKEMWRTWDATVDRGEDPLAVVGPGLPQQDDPVEIFRHIVLLGTSTPHLGLNGAAPAPPRPLVRQGGSLAELYFRGTTQLPAAEMQKIGRSWQSHVAQGSPAVLVECSNDAIDKLPKSFRRIDAEDTGGILLAYGRPETSLGTVDLWLAGVSKAKANALRNLRICLLRLHAERQVLAIVLDRLNSGAISYDPGADNAERIDCYINESTRLIDKSEWKDIDQSKILAALEATRQASTASGLQLSDALQGMRLQIKRKAEKFAERMRGGIYVAPGANFTRNENVTTTTITIGPGATVSGNIVVAGSIQNSFNQLAKATALDDAARKQLEQLLKQIAEVSTKLPDAQAKELADNAEALSKEVASEKPRRRWYEFSVQGLKEAAEAVGEVGKPILQTVATLVPLLAALFP